jgi:hypothetical protein
MAPGRLGSVRLGSTTASQPSESIIAVVQARTHIITGLPAEYRWVYLEVSSGRVALESSLWTVNKGDAVCDFWARLPNPDDGRVEIKVRAPVPDRPPFSVVEVMPHLSRNVSQTLNSQDCALSIISMFNEEGQNPTPRAFGRVARSCPEHILKYTCLTLMTSLTDLPPFPSPPWSLSSCVRGAPRAPRPQCPCQPPCPSPRVRAFWSRASWLVCFTPSPPGPSCSPPPRPAGHSLGPPGSPHALLPGAGSHAVCHPGPQRGRSRRRRGAPGPLQGGQRRRVAAVDPVPAHPLPGRPAVEATQA